jgi:hypothetical protein
LLLLLDNACISKTRLFTVLKPWAIADPNLFFFKLREHDSETMFPGSTTFGIMAAGKQCYVCLLIFGNMRSRLILDHLACCAII